MAKLVPRSSPRLDQPKSPTDLASRDGFYYASVAGDKYKEAGLLPGIQLGLPRINRHGLAGELILSTGQTTSLNITVSSSWSLLLDFNPISKSSIYPYMMGISGAANAFALAWAHDSFANRLIWYDGTAGRDSGFTVPIGSPAVIGITYNAASNVYSFFKDGARGNTQTGVLTGTGNWQFASANNEGNTTNINLLAFADRCVAPTRMLELTANPWQIFEDEVINLYLAAGGGVTAALTGQSLTVAQGNLSAQVQSALSGQSLSLAQGTVVVESGVTAALTGQSLSLAQGSVSPVVSAALSGQAITIAQGSIVAGVSTVITGQNTTLAIGSVAAAIAAPLVGQAVSLAQGDVGIGGDIVRALTGQSLSLAQGSVSVLSAANTFSQEVEIRKFYMRKGKKLLMFDSVAEAEAYTQAEAQADEAIAKANKTSRLARKRLRTRIISPALPAQTIDTDWLAAMMQRFAINLDLPALLAEQDYERVLQIHAMAMKMQNDDEDDVEMFLQQGNDMTEVLEGLQVLQTLVTKMSTSKRKKSWGEYER